MNSETGKWIIGIGLGLVFIGILVYFFADKLHWLGRLPGDIRIEKGNFRLYFPITTMILISILLSLIMKLIQMLRA
ncbi:DUF2905 domain-containing protein [Echinicola sediminis]